MFALSRRTLLLAALLLGAGTAIVAVYIFASLPVHLRVATGPEADVDAKLLRAVNQILTTNHARVRLDLVPTADIHESNLLLGKGQVDLAVVRLDDPLPTAAAVVALLRTDLLIAVAPARHKLDDLSDLKGKHLGLVSRTPLDQPSFVKLLDVFGMKPTDVDLVLITPEEIAARTRNGSIDAVVVIGVPADPAVAAVVYSVDGKKKSPPTILGVDIGAFLTSNTPAASAATISKHAFPHRLIPDDDVSTVGVPTALVANRSSTGPVRAKLYDDAIAALTRTILEHHSEVARQVPLASLITAPDTDKGARFPIHPGATSYLSDTEASWYSLFSDQIWNVVLIAGMLSSFITGISGLLKKKEEDPVRQFLDRLKGLVDRAQSTRDSGELDTVSRDLSSLAIEIATLGYERQLSYEEFAPIQLALAQAQNVVGSLRAQNRE